jgi:preprotein translocase subunit SecE
MAKALATAPHTEETNAGLQRVTAGPERLVEFLKETRQEMHKVVTPTRTEVRTTTMIVLVTVFLFAAYFELVDVVLGRGIDKLFLHLTGH